MLRVLRRSFGSACWSIWLAASAQAAEPPAAEPTTSTAAASQADAEQQYAEGERRYNLGDYVGAASAFERSYELSGIPELLFDIGQAHRLAGPDHCAAARRSYRAYLRSVPGSPHEAEVRARLLELEGCPEAGARRAASAQPPKVDAAVASRSPEQPSAVPPILIGSGAATLVAGGILYLRVRIKYDDAADSCPCPRGKFDTWQNLAYASYALMAVGAATGLVGVTLWQTAGPTPRAALSVSPVGLQLSGTL